MDHRFKDGRTDVLYRSCPDKDYQFEDYLSLSFYRFPTSFFIFDWIAMPDLARPLNQSHFCL